MQGRFVTFVTLTIAVIGSTMMRLPRVDGFQPAPPSQSWVASVGVLSPTCSILCILTSISSNLPHIFLIIVMQSPSCIPHFYLPISALSTLLPTNSLEGYIKLIRIDKVEQIIAALMAEKTLPLLMTSSLPLICRLTNYLRKAIRILSLFEMTIWRTYNAYNGRCNVHFFQGPSTSDTWRKWPIVANRLFAIKCWCANLVFQRLKR